MVELGPTEAKVLATLGIADPDFEGEPLHGEILRAIRRVGPGGSLGSYLSSARFAIVSAHLAAGQTFAETKTRYERAVTRRVVVTMHSPRVEGGPRMSLGLAERMAEDDDEIDALKLRFLVAEKREQTMRKWLDAIAGALDNHRTDRADARAADVASAQRLTGGA